MGTSKSGSENNDFLKDHPHAYGDKGGFTLLGGGVSGSSPRVWGQAANEHLHLQEYRIIPTRMGTS